MKKKHYGYNAAYLWNYLGIILIRVLWLHLLP